MANSINGYPYNNVNNLSTDNQQTIQQDAHALSMLAKMPQTDGIQKSEKSLLGQIDDALSQGQDNLGPMSDEDLTQALSQRLTPPAIYAPGPSSNYGDLSSSFGNGYGNSYGNMDPLAALLNQEGSQYGGDSYGNNQYGGLFSGDAGDADDDASWPEESQYGNNWSGNNQSHPHRGGPFNQANGGFALSNSNGEITSSLDSNSDIQLNGDPHETGTVDGKKLSQTDLMSSHDDLFDDNADINGGFQIGNTVGNATDDGKTYTTEFNATVQGHHVQVSQNNGSDPTVMVDGQTLTKGQTAGPVSFNQDGSIDITGYNDANGAQAKAKITEDSSKKGLNLELDGFQGVNHAGGALVDQATVQGAGTSPQA